MEMGDGSLAEPHFHEQLKCILHLGEDTSEPVKKFSQKMLDNCRQKALVYKFRKTCNYESIVIPEVISDTVGYHTSCYRSFTAVKGTQVAAAIMKLRDLELLQTTQTNIDHADSNSARTVQVDEATANTSNRTLRSSSNVHDSNTRTGVLACTCVFCNKKRKEINNKKEALISCSTENIQRSILEDAKILDHKEILKKFSHVESTLEFVSKEVKYHNSCRNKFHNEAMAKKNSLEKEKESEWLKKTQIRERAFNASIHFIQDFVIEREEVLKSRDVADRYRMLLAEFGLDHSEIYPERDYLFLAKLTEHFEGKIIILKHPTQGVGKIVFSSTIDAAKAMSTVFHVNTSTAHKVQEVAYCLRSLIQNIPRNPLPSKLKSKHIKEGEVTTPELLNLFYTCLLTGTTRNDRKISDAKRIRIGALCDDSIFAVTNGLFKPRTHLELAIYMLSHTGSKEVLSVLNRLGKCVSYQVTQELLTELAFTSCEISRWLPDGLFKRDDLNLMVAHDNFDLFVSTLNGKDTLHDTVSIAIQNIPDKEEAVNRVLSEPEYEDTTVSGTRKRRRRTFVARDIDIAPYHKKPSMSDTMLALEDERRQLKQETIKPAKKMDLLWMVSHYVNKPDTPMWVGFNSQLIVNKQPKQRICYLPQIEASPTRTDVVKETLERSLNVKEECNQKYCSVTYDLAIAKPALCIQKMESPRYDQLFIQLGPFHILMLLFMQ